MRTLGQRFFAAKYFAQRFLHGASGRQLSYWTGSSWVQKPLKYWTGSTWEVKPLKLWDGSSWL